MKSFEEQVLEDNDVTLASGEALAKIGRLIGVYRAQGPFGISLEPDAEYRQRIIEKVRPQVILGESTDLKLDANGTILVIDGSVQIELDILKRLRPHADCEVVVNYADGKPFKYCRNCKIEVTV